MAAEWVFRSFSMANEAEYGNKIDENASAKRKSDYFARQDGQNEQAHFGGVPMDELPSHGIDLGDGTLPSGECVRAR